MNDGESTKSRAGSGRVVRRDHNGTTTPAATTVIPIALNMNSSAGSVSGNMIVAPRSSVPVHHGGPPRAPCAQHSKVRRNEIGITHATKARNGCPYDGIPGTKYKGLVPDRPGDCHDRSRHDRRPIPEQPGQQEATPPDLLTDDDQEQQECDRLDGDRNRERLVPRHDGRHVAQGIAGEREPHRSEILGWVDSPPRGRRPRPGDPNSPFRGSDNREGGRVRSEQCEQPEDQGHIQQPERDRDAEGKGVVGDQRMASYLHCSSI
jgi:hypothetical protein